MSIYEDMSGVLLERRAQENDPDACEELSRRYSIGTYVFSQNIELSNFWMDRARRIRQGEFGNIPNYEEQKEQETYSSVISYFKAKLSNWYGATEIVGHDCNTYVQLNKNYNLELPPIRSNFGISLDDEILFTRDTSFWSESNQGLVITGSAIFVIPDNDNPQDAFTIPWTDLKYVEYKEFTYYFYDYSDDLLATIHYSFFFKNIPIERLEGQKIGIDLAYHFTEMAKIAGEPKSVYDDILALEDAGNYDEAIIQLRELMKNDSIDNDWPPHLLLGRILYKMDLQENVIPYKHYDEIEKELLKAMSKTDYKDLLCICNYWRACNFQSNGQIYSARNLFISSMEAETEVIKNDADLQFKKCEDSLRDVFDNYTSQYEYKDRKFIMPINDAEIAGCYVSEIDTFRMSNIPSCIKFPMGHPVANELYIGHPYNPSLYVPYEQSEDIFFIDKIHELCYLLECLGAKEIAITSIKGKNVDELGDYSNQVNGSGDLGLIDSSFDVSKEKSFSNSQTSNIHRTLRLKFDPIKYPYVPDNLIWFNEEPKWQRLVNSRLHGNMLEYSEFVSTSETKFVSENEKNTIKAAAQYLWVQVEGSNESNHNSQFKESLETQWKVEVTFRSNREFDETSNNQKSASIVLSLTADEQEYLDTLNEFLDDELSERERRMLERMRINLNISKERAKELEASLKKPQLSEDEQEYLEMYEEFVEDGIISEKARKRLEKFRVAYGISEERAKELEKLLKES